MSISTYQELQAMKSTKLTPEDLKRQAAALEAYDRDVLRQAMKERLCKYAVCAIWLGLGILALYVFYKRNS